MDAPLATDLLVGLLASMPLAFAASWYGRITRGGAMSGVLLGGLVYGAFYLAGLLVMGVALAAAIAATRLGGLRLERERGGERRGAANILANCGVGAMAAVAALADAGLGADVYAVWFVAAIAAGASDTVASEIGKGFGGTPRSFPTWKQVPPATPGAVSLLGTVAGAVAAAVIAFPAVVLWLIPASFVLPVVAATTAGAFAESTLSTLFEGEGWLENHGLNVINTAIAALMAAWMCSA